MFDSDQLSVIKWCWWSLPMWTLIRTSVMFRSVRSPRWSSTLWSTWFWLPRLYFCGNQWNSKKGWTHGGQRQQGGSMLCRDELGLQHKPEQRHYQLEQPLKLTTIQPIRLQDVQRNVCVCELTPATLLLRHSPPWHAGRWTNRTTVRMTWAARSTHSTRSHRTRPGSHTHTHQQSTNQCTDSSWDLACRLFLTFQRPYRSAMYPPNTPQTMKPRKTIWGHREKCCSTFI